MEIEIDGPIGQIQEYDYNHWTVNISNCIYSKLTISDFFNNFMMKNRPCLIKGVASDWECSQNWVENNRINYEFLNSNYGDLDAPVADCNDVQYNSHSKNIMKVSHYVEYLKGHNYTRLLYLKDWHLRHNNPNDHFYNIPIHFALDWLNEFAVDNKEDDFMFVYIGPEGSWTPLHEDVYSSYSWSVNVVGRKKWILLPPGEENKLKDSLGNLPLIFEPEKYKNLRYFEITQEKGDAIFVPSGWYHQVTNEVNTISINHNWINACNINIVWKALQKALFMVEEQIEEFKDTPEFTSECQIILKSLHGMNFEGFLKFICYIGKKRLKQLQEKSKIAFGNYYLGCNILRFDLQNILEVMESINTHSVFLNKTLSPSIEKKFKVIKTSITQVLE